MCLLREDNREADILVKLRESYRNLPETYLFSQVNRRVRQYEAEHPDRPVIRLSIGDVTLPLPAAVAEAMEKASREMGTASGFHGYGPEQGYRFLREAIARWDYRSRGVELDPEEIFISDGAKTDCGSIGEIFDPSCRAAVCDPVYPVYAEASAMQGRAGNFDPSTGRWSGIHYLPCTPENGFLPALPTEPVELVYLCFPNNPTGVAAPYSYLKDWVDWANRTGAVLLYDSAYEAFITDPALPRTIYQVEGARSCAIEFRSFSKTAGFTGTRCAYMVIPRELERDGIALSRLWYRRQCARCNGVSYVVQRGAEAVYSPEGREQVRENLNVYRENADHIRQSLSAAGFLCYGGVDSPYIWLKTPVGLDSWTFFDLLLEEAQVAVTPGAGFGPGGEGYVRLTAFGSGAETKEAVERIRMRL